MTKTTFRQKLTQYLFSKDGSKYRLMFRYNGDLICGQPAPDIQVRIIQTFRKSTNLLFISSLNIYIQVLYFQMFTLEFTHHLFSGPKEQIPAMNRVKGIVEEANFTGIVFPFSKGYAAWETDEVST